MFTVVYSRAGNFLANKKVTQPTYPCITEIFHGINFCPCCKDHHRLYVIIKTGQKSSWEKNIAHESRGWKGPKFSSGKFSGYVHVCNNISWFSYWNFTLSFRMRAFESGVLVVQSLSHSEEAVKEDSHRLVCSLSYKSYLVSSPGQG